MPNRIMIILNTPTSEENLNFDTDKYISGSNYREILMKLSEQMASLASGCSSASFEVGSVGGSQDAAKSTFSAEFLDVPAAGESISFGDLTVTFVDGAPENDNEIQVEDSMDMEYEAPSVTELASDLGDKINSLSGIWEAEVNNSALSISFRIPGAIGNLISVTTDASNISLSGLTSDKATDGVGSLAPVDRFNAGY